VRTSLYVVDEDAIAGAIIARAMVKQAVAEQSFRSEQRAMAVRSFRRDRSVRSFRLSAATALSGHHR
jgi:hypothetical protein